MWCKLLWLAVAACAARCKALLLPTRRALLATLPLAVPIAANGYERREVGDENASPETKAMNIQAYETNSRLEREGIRLEVGC